MSYLLRYREISFCSISSRYNLERFWFQTSNNFYGSRGLWIFACFKVSFGQTLWSTLPISHFTLVNLNHSKFPVYAWLYFCIQFIGSCVWAMSHFHGSACKCYRGWLKEGGTFVRSPDVSCPKVTPHIGLTIFVCLHLLLYVLKRLQSVHHKVWQIGWVVSGIGGFLNKDKLAFAQVNKHTLY